MQAPNHFYRVDHITYSKLINEESISNFKPMQYFSQSNHLGGYNVNIELLKRLESYINSDLPKIVSGLNENYPQHYNQNYSITIRHSNNEVKLLGIEHYKQTSCNKNIRSICISYTLCQKTSNTGFSVKLYFANVDKSELLVELTDSYPEEKSAAIVTGILNLLEHNRTTKLPYVFVPLIIFLVSIVALLCTDALLGKVYAHRYIYLISVFVSGIGLVAINHLKSCCTFDTSNQRMRDQWFFWASMGLSTFLLFGTILYFIRKVLLGF